MFPIRIIPREWQNNPGIKVEQAANVTLHSPTAPTISLCKKQKFCFDMVLTWKIKKQTVQNRHQNLKPKRTNTFWLHFSRIIVCIKIYVRIFCGMSDIICSDTKTRQAKPAREAICNIKRTHCVTCSTICLCHLYQGYRNFLLVNF